MEGIKGSHFHAKVRDLPKCVAWFEKTWNIQPEFRMDSMASFRFGSVGLVLDEADRDSELTLAFSTDDCEADFKRFVDAGAQPIDGPTTQPWGVKNAYVKGPGLLTIEIEQELGNRSVRE